MKQMTIRAMDPEIEKAIEELSRERNWSVNQVATYLIRKGLGLTEEVKPQLIGDKLDSFWGKWSKEEGREFDANVADAFTGIDRENWQ